MQLLLCISFPYWLGNNIKSLKMSKFFYIVDVRGTPNASGSQGGGSMNDQEDLSDQSEGESYSYSAPSGEPLSRDTSEPLFDADFQVGKVLNGWLYHIMPSVQYDFTFLCEAEPKCFIFSSIHCCLFSVTFISPQSSTPAAQESPTGDTADLLGLNSDPQASAMSSTSSSAPNQVVQGEMKAASSNSDLLNDLFAPPAAQTGAVQEDLFFSGQPSGATPDAKRKR